MRRLRSHGRHDKATQASLRRVALTIPTLTPFRSHAVGEEGGMSGAGVILRRRLSTLPRPPTSSSLSRAAGEGLGVRLATHHPL